MDQQAAPGFLVGGGEMGALMRAHDWAATPVGPPETWPQTLNTTVRLLLTSRHPMFIFWGKAHSCFYNDAYGLTMGSERHPGSLGQPARQVWDEIWPIIGPQIEQVMQGGEATWHEDQLVPVTRHGRRENAWWTYGYSPIDDPAVPGGVGGVLVICNDITREHLAREALREAEERTRLALSVSDSVGTWDWDVPADLVHADARFARLYGIEPARAEAGAPVAEFTRNIHPADQELVGQAMANALRIGGEFAAEYRVAQGDGSVRWVAAQGRCIQAEDGTPLRFPGVTVDITARKQAEKRQQFLLRLADRLRGLTDSRAIMAAAVEALGRHLAASQVGYGQVQPDDETIVLETGYADGAVPLTGAFPLAAFGADCIARQRQGLTVVHEDCTADPSKDPAAWAAIETRSFVSVPLVRAGRFRASLYVNYRNVHVWPAEDVALVEDVAARTWEALERARAEAELREANEVLEQRIAAALAEREKIEEALRQSQKMEAVGQLTGGIAHDFNNLLIGIAGNLELLQARVAQGQLGGLERYITAAQGASKRAAVLTHRLLAFSRRQTLAPKPADVNRLAGDMIELVRRTMGPAIETEMVAAAGLWTTLVDLHQLENALLNLCINARDAMPNGGRLSIETSNSLLDQRAAHDRDMAPGEYVLLSVSDTGAGMTPEVLQRAFDPFFTTKPIGMGTGLGLSMVYGFARQSGGQARIYSEVGQGTTVCLYLPRHLGEQNGAELDAELAKAQRAEQGETVLVLDDEPTVRTLIAEVLIDLGYTTIEAADGAAGLKILQSDARVDLLITDVGLPGGMNGRQVADAGRGVRPGLKVLFITGYAENTVLSYGDLGPGMHVLTKPFALEVLASRIKSIIAGT